jgi:uncharacterized protein YcbX
MYLVSQLFIYPVKSLGGVALPSARLTDRGFEYDRRWMIVDQDNRFLSQREIPELSLLHASVKNNQLIITDSLDPGDSIEIPITEGLGTMGRVMVWQDDCAAEFVSAAADSWLSRKLSASCRLVYMPESEKRKVDEWYALHKNDITSFSDAYPLMMIGQASLDDLNARLDIPLPVNRFRPNIVFSGGSPYEEDTMAHMRLKGIDLYGAKLCARCAITTVDQAKGIKGKEPLKTLATYRMRDNNVYFGQNLLFNGLGEISIGDSFEVISRKASPLFLQH